MQTKPINYLWETRELILTAKIKKWQVVDVRLQQGTIDVKDH